MIFFSITIHQIHVLYLRSSDPVESQRKRSCSSSQGLFKHRRYLDTFLWQFCHSTNWLRMHGSTTNLTWCLQFTSHVLVLVVLSTVHCWCHRSFSLQMGPVLTFFPQLSPFQGRKTLDLDFLAPFPLALLKPSSLKKKKKSVKTFVNFQLKFNFKKIGF